MTKALGASARRMLDGASPAWPGPGPYLALALLAVAAGLFPGCVVETVSAPASGVAVSGPPPEPVRETAPAPPSPRAIWVAGYWHWTGMQYTWIPGHWELGPPGARWRAPHYSLRDGTYFYEPGGWSQR